ASEQVLGRNFCAARPRRWPRFTTASKLPSEKNCAGSNARPEKSCAALARLLLPCFIASELSGEKIGAVSNARPALDKPVGATKRESWPALSRRWLQSIAS